VSAAAVLAAVPGSVVAEESSADRRRRAVNYMHALWRTQTGTIAIASGVPHLDSQGRYKHADFGQMFGTYPDDIEVMTSRAIDLAAAGRDVYVAPMLRTERERKKASGAGGSWAWCDMDGPLTEVRRAVIARLGDAVIVVSSGTGHHVYVRLDGWHSPEDVEAVNRSLVDALDGDAKWSNESLLRLPGTFNLKPLILRNEAPALVQGVRL
jgi:hypothetical protein